MPDKYKMADRDDKAITNFYSRSQLAHEKLVKDAPKSRLQQATRYESMITNQEFDSKDPRQFIHVGNTNKPAPAAKQGAARANRQYGSITYLNN